MHDVSTPMLHILFWIIRMLSGKLQTGLGMFWLKQGDRPGPAGSAEYRMAHVLFSNSTDSVYNAQEERSSGNIRLSIFLLAGLCAGLPALVWALRVLYGHYKSGGRISALVIMLLLSDLLELLLSPYVVTKLLQDDDCWDSSWTCRLLTSVWSASVIYGLHLQQVVALEAALSFRHPPCSAHVIFPSCFGTVSIIAFISFFLCEYFRIK
ncbi:hypothetical protein NFI96_008855 [Prochilodus magdalenae]|nr:hypothetical protein NFI96_008855 [Prochilodus magdalenae]